MDLFMRAANESAAIALMDAGNYPGAEARLRTMLSADSNDARALALLAHCRFATDDDKGGLEIARSAAAIDPDDPLVKRTLAHGLIRNNKFKEADAIVSDLAADDPEDSNALFKLAIARFGQKDYLGAKQLFDEAEEHAGDSVNDLLNVARLRLHQWNYASAASLAKRAMMLDPNQGESFHILGECALAAKEPVEAYELALESLRLAPGEKLVMRLLTRARARQNPLLKPFLPGVDWIVEMDRRGLVILPILMTVLGAMLFVSAIYDLARVEAGRSPAIVISVGLGVLFVYALVSYLTAATARARIRRDLRKISLLPRF
jgi:predicted Zn-dependent protease